MRTYDLSLLRNCLDGIRRIPFVWLWEEDNSKPLQQMVGKIIVGGL